MILFATCTGDYPLPATACLIQHQLGATSAAACDLSAACCGFVYAFSVADAYVKNRHAPCVGGRIRSDVGDYRLDRSQHLYFVRRWGWGGSRQCERERRGHPLDASSFRRRALRIDYGARGRITSAAVRKSRRGTDAVYQDEGERDVQGGCSHLGRNRAGDLGCQSSSASRISICMCRTKRMCVFSRRWRSVLAFRSKR